MERVWNIHGQVGRSVRPYKLKADTGVERTWEG